MLGILNQIPPAPVPIVFNKKTALKRMACQEKKDLCFAEARFTARKKDIQQIITGCYETN